jgi:hypothetical protein
MLPNFLVIGPGKSGTTWLYHALKNHPEVCVSSAKETLFFETEFKRGIDWYEDFFSHCDQSVKAVGEVSNTYVFCKDAPKRIKSVNPDIKLISCLRNPIERTFSHYLFLVRGGQVTSTFSETLKNRPDLIDKGKYFKNLKPYFDTFDKRQFCVKLFDELKTDQVDFIQSIYSFLNVNESYKPQVDYKSRLSAAKPRNRFLASLAKRGALLMRQIGHPQIISKIKYSGITKLLYKEYKEDEKPEINIEDRAFLKKQFAKDLEKLSELLNRDLKQIWVM